MLLSADRGGLRRWHRSLLGILVFAICWQLAGSADRVLFPPLEKIASSLLWLIQQGTMLDDLLASVGRVLAGVLISCATAWALGLVAALVKAVPDYLSGVVELLRPVPPIAWTPVAIIAFGIGNGPAVAIVALGSFFPIWFGVVQGLGEVRTSHLRAAMSLGCGVRLLLTDVIIPSALPYAIHGVRLGVGMGWFCVVAAEMMGASSGLGYGVQLSSMNIEMEKLYAYLFMIGMVGFASNLLLEALDRRVGGTVER